MAASVARNSRRLAAAGGRSRGFAGRQDQVPQKLAALAACGGNEPAMRGLDFLRPPVSRTAAFPSLVRGTPSFCWPPSFRRKISSLRAPPWAAFFACPPPRRAAGCGRIYRNSPGPPFSHAAAALDPAAMTRGWRARRRARSRWARCTAPPKSFCSRNEADTRWQPAGADCRGGSAPASNRCPHEEKDLRKAQSCRRGIRPSGSLAPLWRPVDHESLLDTASWGSCQWSLTSCEPPGGGRRCYDK